MVDDVIILAGGSGTRLWPASTKAMPKQFLDLDGRGSLLKQTVERAAATGADGEIVIVTLQDQVEGILADVETYPWLADRIVVLPEPTARNTAPAIAFALQYLSSRGRADGVSLVLAADHAISPSAALAQDVEKADRLARGRFLVTFAVRPTRPETGYGYLEAGEEQAPGFLVQEFKEKPDRRTAEKYASSGRHYWNSGMFVFPNRFFLSELAAYEPAVAGAFENAGGLAVVPAGAGVADAESGRAELSAAVEGRGTASPSGRSSGHGPRVVSVPADLRSAYERLPKISVDYAVMERSDRCAMVPASFAWSDVGSWDEVAKLESDPHADVVEVAAAGNFVYSDLPVAICGLDGVHVVVKNGMVLVCKRGESQLVKEVVTRLESEGRSDSL